MAVSTLAHVVESQRDGSTTRETDSQSQTERERERDPERDKRDEKKQA